MNVVQSLQAEWQNESKLTRKMLERVPADKLEWKPHPKSMSLGFLALHLGGATKIFAQGVVKQDNYMWTSERQGEPSSKEEILETFDTASSALTEALLHLKEEQLSREWSLGPKENPMMKMPKSAAIRGFLFSHLIHHRGQLSVYLRLLDVPVPGIYGPSADEK